MKKFFKYSYLAIILLLLYLPIAVLIIFSFNSGDSVRNFQSWSWVAYARLFQQTTLWQSLSVTIIVALVSTIIATIIGTFGALGMSKTRKLTRSMTLGITNIPLVNADIVTAVSLMLLFSSFAFNFGIFTLILAHISFDIPYVIITVLPKIRSIDKAQLEASQDLGASPWYTLRKVVFPSIRPAVITGAAIAFAMSFDDFIISYFTGGNAANVSVYIYSLKRVQPFVNAFSTLIIVAVALLVISFNAYKIIRKQIRLRNEMIMNQTYRDKKIIGWEKTLNKYYLQLNFVKVPKRRRKNQQILFQPIEKLQDETIAFNFLFKRIKKNEKIIKNIIRLEEKLEKEQIWVQEIKNSIIEKKQDKENRSKSRREKYWFLNWPWKLISASFIVAGVFSGAVALYINTNEYNLSVANWGEYLTPGLIKSFENTYHVKVKYSTYDDNESLYAKLFTTNYDVMVPSDYMVEQLAVENKIVDLSTQFSSEINKLDKGIVQQLHDSMTNYKFTIAGEEKNLLNYSVPYFWGNLILVFNTDKDPNLLNELGVQTEPNGNLYTNWEVLKKAIGLKKDVVLNDDMHNLFSLALTSLHYENVFHLNNGKNTPGTTNGQVHNMFQDYVNAQSVQQVQAAAQWLKPLISSPYTRLQNDELIDTVAEPKGWDLAVMYNGDLLASLKENPSVVNNYKVAIPYVGTNIWDDNMVISQKSKHKQLAFKFIKFIANYKTQEVISSIFGYTSPYQNSLTNVSKMHPEWANWKSVYDPNKLLVAPKENPSATPGFYNGQFHNTFDKEMQAQLNNLLATQGSSNTTALFIELGILLIIIVGFILLIIFIR